MTVMAVSIWSDNNLNKKGIGMAKYKLQELTDMRNEGKRRVYPKIVTNRTLSRKEFIKRMQSYHVVFRKVPRRQYCWMWLICW